MPLGFVCVSFACNNRLGNRIESYKKKRGRGEEGETGQTDRTVANSALLKRQL